MNRDALLALSVQWLSNLLDKAQTSPAVALALLNTQPEGAPSIQTLATFVRREEIEDPARNDVTRLNREEKSLILSGKKIPAIKCLRDRSVKENPDGTKSTTLGLREAKDLCDAFEDAEIRAGRMIRDANGVRAVIQAV